MESKDFYKFYHDSVCNDAHAYCEMNFENLVYRNDSGKIIDYLSSDDLYDELFTDCVCGNGPWGHDDIPDDLGEVFFTQMWYWVMEDMGFDYKEYMINPSNLNRLREIVDYFCRTWMLGQVMGTVYEDFEDMVVHDGE